LEALELAEENKNDYTVEAVTVDDVDDSNILLDE